MRSPGQRSLATGSPAVSGFVLPRSSKVARLLSLALARRFSSSVPTFANRRQSSTTGAALAAYSMPRSFGLDTQNRLFAAEPGACCGGGADPEDFAARALVVDHLVFAHVFEALVEQRLGDSVAESLANLVPGHGHSLSPQNIFDGPERGQIGRASC